MRVLRNLALVLHNLALELHNWVLGLHIWENHIFGRGFGQAQNLVDSIFGDCDGSSAVLILLY